MFFGNPPCCPRADIPPLWWPEALPTSQLDYGALACQELRAAGDVPAAVSLQIMPSGTGELQALDLGVSGDLVIAALTGGQPGRVYETLITVTGESGRVWPTTVFLRIGLAGALPWEIPPAPAPGYGTPINWTRSQVVFGSNFVNVATGLVGTGTNQATATSLGAFVNEIASCPAGAGFILTSTDFVSGTITVQNDDPVNDAAIYPPVGAVINGLGVNLPFYVPAGGGRIDFSTDSPTTFWFGGGPFRRAYGEMTITDNETSLTLTDQNAYYQIVSGWTADQVKDVVLDPVAANMVATVAGQYKTTATIVFTSAEAAQTIQFNIFKNNNPISDHTAITWFNTTTFPNTVTADGIDMLNAGDVLDLRVQCLTAAGQVMTITDCNFNIERIG